MDQGVISSSVIRQTQRKLSHVVKTLQTEQDIQEIYDSLNEISDENPMDFLFNDRAIYEYGADIQKFVDDVEVCFEEYQREANVEQIPLRQIFKDLMSESFGDQIKWSDTYNAMTKKRHNSASSKEVSSSSRKKQRGRKSSGTSTHVDINDDDEISISQPNIDEIKSAMKKILSQLRKDKRAAPFSVPVDLNAAPGYEEVIPIPMDLSTVRANITSGVYGTDIFAFARDIRLIWSNCMTYNEPGSVLYEHASELKLVFEQLYQSEFQDILKAMKRKSTKSDNPIRSVDMQEGEDASKGELLKKMKKLLKEVYNRPESEPFHYPVDVSAAPGYLDAVSRPMDLSYLKKHLSEYATGDAADLGRFLDDMLLIFDNCMAYNVDGSDLFETAKELREFTKQLFTDAFPDSVKSSRLSKGPSTGSVKRSIDLEGPPKKKGRPSKASLMKSAEASALLTEDPQKQGANVDTSLLKQLKKLLKEVYNRPESEPFHYPVDVSAAPGYLDAVSRPMDLSYLKKHLSEYATGDAADLGRFLDDMLLIFDNCMAYNVDGSDLFETAKELREFTRQQYNQIFLQQSSKVEPSEKSAAKIKSTVSASSSSPPVSAKDANGPLLKKMKRLLRLVYENPKSEPFHYPVDVSAAPGYLDTVSRPMDLSYLKKHLSEYATGDAADLGRFLDDMLLIFDNCMAYNVDGSDLFETAKELSLFVKQQYNEIFPSKSAVKKSEVLAAPIQPLNAEVHRALKRFLKAMYDHPNSTPFQTPIDLSSSPGYLDVVKRPIDLSYVKRHLTEYATGERAGVERFLDDILRIFENCRLYESSDSENYNSAVILGTYANELYSTIFYKRYFEVVKRKIKRSLSPPVAVEDMNVGYHKRLKRLLKTVYDNPLSVPFHFPVDTSAAPGYLDVVARPMDLSYLSKHLAEYATGNKADIKRFLDDMLLIFDNCIAYNADGTELYNAATALSEFVKLQYEEIFPADYFEKTTRKSLARPRSPPVIVEDANLDVLKLLKKFLKNIVDHPKSSSFMYPVDLNDAPGYLDVVTRPMDLSYIKKHLAEYASGSARDIQCCLDDILLIFENCRAYESSESEKYMDSVALTDFTKELFSVSFSAKYLQKLAENETNRDSKWGGPHTFDAKNLFNITTADIISGDVEALQVNGDNDDAIMSSGIRDSLKMAEKNSHSLFDNEIASMSFDEVFAFHMELQSDRALHSPIVREKAHNDSKKFLKHFLVGKSSSDLYVCGSLGTIGADGCPGFHNQDYIFPVGYSCKRTLILSVVPSTANDTGLDREVGGGSADKAVDEELVNPVEYPHVEVVFNTLIKKATDNEGKDYPVFQVTVGEGIIVAESTVSPGAAWQQTLMEGPQILHCLGSRLRRCRAVLNRLCTSPDIVPYLDEVPSEGPVGESYYKKIKSPMWLREIHRRLVEGSYDNEFDFAWDVRLVFANCMDYNKEDSELYKSASNILDHFEKLFCSWVLNVRDPNINTLATGVWDDWTSMRYLDGSDDKKEICCHTKCSATSSARNKLFFCEFCEDFYCSDHCDGGEDDVSDITNKKVWRCRRCVDILTHEFDLPDVNFRISEDPSGLYAPAEKMGRGWNHSSSGYMSPLGYEFASIAQAKSHIVTEKQLNSKLLAERAKEFEEYKKTNFKTSKKANKKKLANASPMHHRPKRARSESLVGGKDKEKSSGSKASGEDDAENGSDGGKNLMLNGKLSNLDLEGSNIVWAGLAEETTGGLFLGIFTPELLSPAGFSGLDDYIIHRSIEGLPGSLECENYVFENAESIVKSYRKAVSSVVERREREHKADAQLQKKITEERYFWRNMEAKCRQEQKKLLLEASKSWEKVEGIIAENRAFHNDMNGILNTLLPSDWDVSTDEFEALIYVWEFLNVSKKHSISPIFGLTEIVKSVLPGKRDNFPTVAGVIFDEACVMMVDVLMADLRRILYGHNVGLWQEYLIVHPLNVLTWPHLAYNLLLTLTRLNYSKSTSPASAQLTLNCAKDSYTRLFAEILYLIECYIMATVANHSTDGIPDTTAERDLVVFSEFAADVCNGEITYDDKSQFICDVRDMVENFIDKNPLHSHLHSWLEGLLVEYALDGLIDRSLCGLGEAEVGRDVVDVEITENAEGQSDPFSTASLKTSGEAPEGSEKAGEIALDSTERMSEQGPILAESSTIENAGKKNIRKVSGDVLKSALIDNLAVSVRILLRKDPCDFTSREKIAVYGALAQIGFMSATMSAVTVAIIKAARANEAPISPLPPQVQANLIASLQPVDTSHKGSGVPPLSCYFTGLEAKNIDDGGDWVYVPDEYLTTPVLNSSITKTLLESSETDAAGDSEETTNALSLRQSTTRTLARGERDREREGKKVCLKQMLLKVAAARESAKDEFSGVSANGLSNIHHVMNVIGSIKSILDRIGRIEILHRALPLGYDRMGREYWMLDSQAFNVIGSTNPSQGGEVLDEPALLVRNVTLGMSWSYISRSNVPRFIALLSPSHLCEDFLKQRLQKQLSKIIDNSKLGFLKIRDVAWSWLNGFKNVDDWVIDIAKSVASPEMQYDPRCIALLELAYARCTEARLSVHYATIARHIGHSSDHRPVNFEELLVKMTTAIDDDVNREMEVIYRRKMHRTKIVDLIFDVHGSNGWHRSDSFGRIRFLSACTTATDLLADPLLRETLKSILHRSAFRKPNPFQYIPQVRVRDMPPASTAPTSTRPVRSTRSSIPFDHSTALLPGNASGKAIDQLDINTGEVLRTWNSGSEAAFALNISHTGISQCCNGNKADANGFKWRFSRGRLPDERAVPIQELIAMKKNLRGPDAYGRSLRGPVRGYVPRERKVEPQQPKASSVEMSASTVMVPFRMLKMKVELLNIVAILPDVRIQWDRHRSAFTHSDGKSTDIEAVAEGAFDNGIPESENEDHSDSNDDDGMDEDMGAASDNNEDDRDDMEEPEEEERQEKVGEGDSIPVADKDTQSGLVSEVKPEVKEEDVAQPELEEDDDMEGSVGIDDVDGERDEYMNGVQEAGLDPDDELYTTDYFVQSVQEASTYEDMLYLIDKLENALGNDVIPFYKGSAVCTLSECAADVAMRLYTLDRAIRYEDLPLNLSVHNVGFRPRTQYTPKCVIAPECTRPLAHSGKCDMNVTLHDSRYQEVVPNSVSTYPSHEDGPTSAYFPQSVFRIQAAPVLSLDAIQPYIPRPDEIASEAWI